MRIFERVIVVGVREFRPSLVMQTDHRIQRRPIPRGVEIEGQRLSLSSRKPEMIVVGRLDRAVDQKRKVPQIEGFAIESFGSFSK